MTRDVAMSISSAIIDPMLTLHGVAAYALVAVLAFAEAAVLLGFVLPGETAVILGGVLAYRHSVSLPVMIGVVVLAAIAGDSVGYEVGRRYGDRLLRLKIFRRHDRAIEAGRRRLREVGGRVVLLSRFTAFLRAVTPGLAGTIQMPYRKFVAWNAAGGVLWGVGFTLLGYFAGASYVAIENVAGRLSEAVLGLVALTAVAWFLRNRARERKASDQPQPGSA
jgi:membrane protein DedA with SNARE-associated domain